MLFRKPGVLLLALILDAFLGDPANRWHPVAWMGNLIGWLKGRSPQDGHAPQFLYGGIISIGGASLLAIGGKAIERISAALPSSAAFILDGWFLSLMIATRRLGETALEVGDSLEENDLPQARHLVGYHLVSRDTSNLTEAQVCGATIESVAENASDSVIAPLLYYSLGGLPGVVAYRFVNTCDAMLGYRDTAHEWLGKISARFDDLLNLIPARLSALTFVLTAHLANGDAHRGLQIWKRDRKLTASPNAGHPMSAVAGVLGISLEKENHYTLGEGGSDPQAVDILRTVRLMQFSVLLASLMLSISMVLIRMIRRKQR